MGIENGIKFRPIRKSPELNRAVKVVNDRFGIETEKDNLDNVRDTDIIPVGKIRDIVDGPLESSTCRNEQLMLKDPINFNQALQRSMVKMVLSGVPFPNELAELADQPVFRNALGMCLYEMGIKTAPSCVQVRFSGNLNDDEVYSVHLADVIGGELFLTDIVLSDPRDARKRVMGGLGHGVFDEIMLKIEEFAKQNRYRQIGLIAAFEKNMNTFSKRGFVVEENLFGKNAHKMGMSYPMVKFLK